MFVKLATGLQAVVFTKSSRSSGGGIPSFPIAYAINFTICSGLFFKHREGLVKEVGKDCPNLKRTLAKEKAWEQG